MVYDTTKRLIVEQEVDCLILGERCSPRKSAPDLKPTARY
ncbi:hypothetical protein Metme_4313 [Methylomonas methanica MC09]|uniref:Uncharacterized protein n=1 Tax=Methylomonas methanica (strain DSM 25384 / MC09) TaxID=857087 RepID=G0A303_METMM|nr:hypothetical protein Metme_4313 [Methylomonas methanica MC09]